MDGRLHRLADALRALPGRPGACAALLVAACLVAYAGSPFNGFVLDDHPIVQENPLVQQPSCAFEAFGTPYQGGDRGDRLYRPLTVLSLAAGEALHGPVPGAFHAVNVLLHVLATLLAFAFARALLPGRPGAALLAGLLFAVHPIHSDAVSSIVNRSEVLAAGFAMAAFLAWRRWLLGRSPGWLVLAGAAFLAGVLSKESGAPLPAFAAAWAIPRAHRARGRAAVAAGFVAAFAVPSAAYLLLRAHALDGELVGATHRYFQAVDRGTAFLTMAGVLARYGALLIWPSPLSADYSFDSIPLAGSALDPWPLAGLLALPVLAAATAILLARRSDGARGAGFGLLWAGLFLAPAANLVPLTIPMAERITYAATAGASVAGGAALALVPARWPRLGTAAVALLLAALCARTVDRDRDWHDDATLASATVTAYPRNALMWANLGAALANQGRPGPAVGAFRRALEVAPAQRQFRLALAGLLHDTGHHAEEAEVLREGLAHGPRIPGDVERACDAAVEADPGLDPAACRARLAAP